MDLGVSVVTTVGSLYTFDGVLKEVGLEPIFVPLIKRLIPNSSSLEIDPAIASDREHQIITDKLKQLHKRTLSFKEDEKLFQTWFETNLLSREDLIELGRGIKNVTR